MELNKEIYEKGLAKFCVDQGLRIFPLLMKWDLSKGVSLMNPSIYNDDGKLKCNIRIVNYNMSHSEFSKYPHWSGPLQYIHPEDDVTLKTENILVDLDDDFSIVDGNYINMQNLHDPIWHFIGLEDGRLVRWDNKLYLIGVRRDTTKNGQGRMELSEIDESTGNEISRVRIPTTGNDDSYCEKNWMPILDRPYTFVKWSSPTEVAYYDHQSDSTQSIITKRFPTKVDVRGGSQVVKWGDYYVAFGHSVKLWKPYSGEKASRYYHHIIVWNSNFDPIYISEPFSFTDVHIEFCCGLCEYNGLYYASFSTRDNSSYILELDFDSILGGEVKKFDKNKDHREKYKDLYGWIDDLNGIQSNINIANFLYKSGQISSSITHYLKVAEIAKDNEFELKYHCLEMVSLGYERLGRRWKGALQYATYAMTEQPDRPEAYASMCRIWTNKLFYEGTYEQFDWIEVFKNSKIGLIWAGVKDYPKTPFYNGINELETHYVRSLDRIGRVEELKKYLSENNFDEFDPEYRDIIIDVCNSLEIMNPFNDYSRVKDKIGLNSKFISENVKENKSQIFQDIFAVINKESKDGTYLELGASVPVHHNNTWLLEKLGWDGVSIEIEGNLVSEFSKERKNKIILDNTYWHDYDKTISDLCSGREMSDGKYVVDYLSVDVCGYNIDVLYKIPFKLAKFRCITFEHDCYRDGNYTKEQSREYMKSLGYKLVGEDIKYNSKNSFEDWYIYPDLVKDKRIQSNIYKLTKYVQSI